MSKILKLDKQLQNKISAGEVVEKPASIVKELVENSLDAGATNIYIEIEDGGSGKIAIYDNGCGITSEDVELAFMPHATSKIKCIEDLNTLATMGFRGEALSSISAVAKVELTTKTATEQLGTKIIIEGGEFIKTFPISCANGTSIIVRNLFYNVPARAKFLRKPKTEENEITNVVQKFILSNPMINFKYIVNSKIIYNTTCSTMYDIIYTIYGNEIADNMVEVSKSSGKYKVTGYISNPPFSKANRTYQSIFVNGRYVQNQTVSSAVAVGFKNFLMKGVFPVFILKLELPAGDLDVNVHPNKLEVKFANPNFVFSLISSAVYECISKNAVEKDFFGVSNKFENSYKFLPLQNRDSEIKEIDHINTNGNKDTVQDNKYEDYFKDFAQKKFNESQKDFVFESNSVIQHGIDLDNITPIKEEKLDVVTESKSQNFFEDMLSYKIIGTLFLTYVIVECKDCAYFIDQHAAHERQLFDKFVKEAKDGSIVVQNLLIPEILSVNPAEVNFLCEWQECLNDYGFFISQFGNNCFKISAVPLSLSQINLKQFFNNLLEDLSSLSKKPAEFIKNELATRACKSAVKAGQQLCKNEIEILIAKFEQNNGVLLCPHGRPFVLKMNKNSFEKLFKRIV
ncbi:MAG: DNA mismatch repair endonuclease MutL [Clostridia bacterium]